jgi:hypothetical protein
LGPSISQPYGNKSIRNKGCIPDKVHLPAGVVIPKEFAIGGNPDLTFVGVITSTGTPADDGLESSLSSSGVIPIYSDYHPPTDGTVHNSVVGKRLGAA